MNTNTVYVDINVHRNKVRLAAWLLTNLCRNLHALNIKVEMNQSTMDTIVEWINNGCVKGHKTFFVSLLSQLEDKLNTLEFPTSSDGLDLNDIPFEINHDEGFHKVTFTDSLTHKPNNTTHIDTVYRITLCIDSIRATMGLVNKLHFSHKPTDLTTMLDESVKAWDNDFDDTFNTMKTFLAYSSSVLTDPSVELVNKFDVNAIKESLEHLKGRMF